MYSIETIVVDDELIDRCYAFGTCTLELGEQEYGVNSYVVLRSNIEDKKTAVMRYLGYGEWQRMNSGITIEGISGKDVHQSSFLDIMKNEDVLLNVCIGAAGTGKTTMAIAYAVHRWFNEGKKILMAKPTAMVGKGKAFGPVPGTIEEKYAPYLASYEIVLKKIFGDKGSAIFQRMKQKKDLDFIPIEMARGCTFDDCTFILDEAQNLDWHELNTIVSRMGEGTKMLILGDLHQIDTKCRKTETGLHKMVSADPFFYSDLCSLTTLQTQYRSPITQLVADIDEFVRN